MANIETWCCNGKLAVEVTDPSLDRRTVIQTEGDTHNGCLRMTIAEAVALRNDLSRAITEAATAAAKAVA